MGPTLNDTIFTTISLFSSVASLALAVIAIWIALYGKREAERTNQKTQDLLTEVKSDAKSIAQYALPELTAYGDSVRKFAFQKGGSSSEASSLLGKVERIITENNHRIQGEIDSIRDVKDITEVRQKLDDLEAELRSSQESVRKSVEESAQELSVDHEGTPKWGFPFDDWEGFLQHLESNEGYKLSEYGKRWTLYNPRTGSSIPETQIWKRLPISELDILATDRLNLMEIGLRDPNRV